MIPLARVAFLVLGGVALFAQEQPSPDVDDLLSAGRTSYSKGDFAGARTAMEQAWTIAQQSPKDDPRRYSVLKQLSASLTAAGDYTAARDYIELAIHWRETVLGRADPGLPGDLAELAMLCERLKEYPRALAILERVHAIHVQTGGEETAVVADDLSHMAMIHLGNHKPELAADALREAIEIRQKLLGPEHPGLVPELDRLAAIRILNREYEPAEQTYRRALLIRERFEGRDDADLIASVEGLAFSLFGQKKYEEAESAYKRLLGLWETSMGPDHAMVAVTLDKMAMFYREQARWHESEEAAARADRIRVRGLANGLIQEATAQKALGDPQEALRLYRQALDVLDPSGKENDELRQRIQASIRELVEGPDAKNSVGRAR
jgi:tetratricopeptide (TPR) repeat protein